MEISTPPAGVHTGRERRHATLKGRIHTWTSHGTPGEAIVFQDSEPHPSTKSKAKGDQSYHQETTRSRKRPASREPDAPQRFLTVAPTTEYPT